MLYILYIICILYILYIIYIDICGGPDMPGSVLVWEGLGVPGRFRGALGGVGKHHFLSFRCEFINVLILYSCCQVGVVL